MSKLAKSTLGILATIAASLVISLPFAFFFSLIPNAHIIVTAQYLGLDPHVYGFMAFEAVLALILTLGILAAAKRR